jgi:lipopolysaccharide/colanic/teichoic acid biosynthesis glycosyltransferase
VLVSPVLVIFVSDRIRFWHNLSQVFSGKKTWVSYASEDANDYFPKLKPGILSPTIILYREDEIQALRDSDYYYARDYSVWKDLSLVLNNFKNLGKR